MNEQKKLEIFSAAQLADENPQPPRFIIQSILPVGLVVFAAPPKSGKSWLALNIANAVAEGVSVFGFDVEQGSVLYLALEDSGFRLNARLRAIGSRMPPTLQMAIRGAENIGGGLLEQLVAWRESVTNPKLIVIDTIGRLKGAGKPGLNAYENDTALYGPLQQFAVKNGLSVMAVSHFSKVKNFAASDIFERITGSTGLFGVADAAWVLYGKRGETQTTLRVTGRDITDTSFRLSFNAGIWKMDGVSEALERQEALDRYRRSPLLRTIVSLVHKNGRWEGNATQLIEETLTRESDCDAATVQEVGQKILSNKSLLSEIDHIGYIHGKGGRQGRGYIFIRTDQPVIQ